MSNFFNHYVYCHLRQDTNKVFYIGKGQKRRAYNVNSRNAHWKNIVNKAGGFTVLIIASNLTNTEALNFERILIISLKQQTDINLCNLTDGGDGVYNPSEETRLKQKKAKIGKLLSENTKQKISQSLFGNKRSLGFKQTKTTVEKRRKSVIGTKRSKEACLNISIAKKAKNFKHSEETKLKISLTKKMKEKDGDNISICCK
jgi:hypothetical protein